jgi:site-specific DNA recombinase
MRAAIYTRISEDDGTALGVGRQEKDARALADRKGWDVARVYVDNDVSATRSKVRPGYQQMMQAIDRGDVDAVVVWDVDRLTRTPRELEDIIDLADRRGLALASVGGDIDLATPQGRMTARIKGTVARHETEQMSRRIRRSNDERAARGDVHGRPGYGYTRALDGTLIVDEEQAAIVREAAHRALAGESLRSIAKDLIGRSVGSPGRSGTWNTTTLRQLLLRPSVAGLRQHRGQIIGRLNVPPVIDEDTRTRLVILLTDPSRRSHTRGKTPVHLLSGIALCGRCGGKMHRLVPWVTKDENAKTKSQPAAYACSECYRVRRKQVPVDEYVTELVLSRLEQPDAINVFTSGDDEQVRHAHDRLATIDAKLAEAADAFADGSIDGAQLKRITERLRIDQERAKVTLTDAMPKAIPSEVVGLHARRAWEGLSMDKKRAVITVLMTVTILPSGPGIRGFNPDLVRIDWL